MRAVRGFISYLDLYIGISPEKKGYGEAGVVHSEAYLTIVQTDRLCCQCSDNETHSQCTAEITP